jgi:hypothetical protein
MQYVMLTYSATILAIPDDSRVQPKHVMSKKGVDNNLHLRRKYMCAKA